MATIRVFKHYVRVPFLLLGLAEAGIITAAMYIGAYLRFYGHSADEIAQSLGYLLPRALGYTAVTMTAMTAMGMYQAKLRDGMNGIMLRLAVSFILAGLALGVVFYLLPSLFLGRGVVGLATLISFFGVACTSSKP